MNFIKKVYESTITKIIILLAVILGILIINHRLSIKFGIKAQDLQSVYYFFSTAAQSIAALIAFLLAGYALVYQAMDNLENRDDTLIDIHHKIKTDYYRKIKWLAIITGFAIISSLIMIWFNGFETPLKDDLALVSFLFIVLAIIGGLWFVIYIIDPNKFRKVARQIINEKYISRGEVVDEGDLLKVFINLERKFREIILKNELQGRNTAKRREIMSFREMLDILNFNELIPRELYDQLQEINRYRNLVVHGHVTQVDEKMVREAEQALEEITRIIKERFNRDEQ